MVRRGGVGFHVRFAAVLDNPQAVVSQHQHFERFIGIVQRNVEVHRFVPIAVKRADQQVNYVRATRGPCRDEAANAVVVKITCGARDDVELAGLRWTGRNDADKYESIGTFHRWD
jgi:hypothetical protein